MAERKRIGLLFSMWEGWIGGSYYYLNLISALNLLNDEDKPEIIVYSSDSSGYDAAMELGYPFLSNLKPDNSFDIFNRILNKALFYLNGRKIIFKKYPKSQLPILFGYYEQMTLHDCERKIYWIPDFQEHYYPHLIGVKESANRIKLQKLLVKRKAEIVFSSNDALNDFNRFYPNNNCKKSVLNFAVTHPDISKINFSDLKGKFRIHEPYFFTANQFWPHKNHLTILKAIKILKDRGKEVFFLFSGKSDGSQSHVRELFDYIEINNLGDNVNFLGFLERRVQLKIMEHSLAVVQPSLFEGWSTVVEDAKSLHRPIILSNLNVHKEQIEENGLFFEASNEFQLAQLLEEAMIEPPRIMNQDYVDSILNFGNKFVQIL